MDEQILSDMLNHYNPPTKIQEEDQLSVAISEKQIKLNNIATNLIDKYKVYKDLKRFPPKIILDNLHKTKLFKYKPFWSKKLYFCLLS